MPVIKVKQDDGTWVEVDGVTGHTHLEYATVDHVHSYNNLTERPTSLPANGGNADTVDGKHASDFASASTMSTVQSNVTSLQNLVGSTSVANQISSAMASVSKITYGTTDLTAGTSTLATGAIYLVYEAV